MGNMHETYEDVQAAALKRREEIRAWSREQAQKNQSPDENLAKRKEIDERPAVAVLRQEEPLKAEEAKEEAEADVVKQAEEREEAKTEGETAQLKAADDEEKKPKARRSNKSEKGTSDS
jgi:hypothetical protein